MFNADVGTVGASLIIEDLEMLCVSEGLSSPQGHHRKCESLEWNQTWITGKDI